MAPEPFETHGPTVAAVVRRTLARLPADSKRGLTLVLAAYAAIVAFHVWDTQDRPGPRGMAELASVALGTGGILLYGLTEVLRRAEEPSVPPRSLLGIRPAAADVEDTPALRQILFALPAIGALSTGLLAAAVAVIVARVWLGASIAVLAIAAVYVGALAAAVRMVGQASERLYTHGQRESARLARAESQVTEARLAALQAQMNPHFLFNALNTVASLIRTNPRAAETTVENLSDVLRATLLRSRETRGTLAEEVDFVRAYLAVESARLGSRLTVEWAIDPAAEHAALPPLMLQPLVENALKHGIGHRREGGRLQVSAARAGDRLRIEVADDGEGFATPHREGTGLGNVRNRLAVLYGSAATLAVESSSHGARVTLDLPYATG